jgi:phage tail protein X
MTRRKRSRIWYLVTALVVGAILYWAQIWPFQRSEAPPPGSIAAGSDGASDAYDDLSADFRAKVSLTEFADMLHRMTDVGPGDEEPQIRLARATDPTGPERPVVRFEADYPATQVGAEYHFARVEGKWELRSLRLVKGQWKSEATEDDTAPEPAKSADKALERRAEGPPIGRMPPSPPAPAVAVDGFPREYVIQGGDNLSSISRHFYGTTTYWRRILEANPGLRERRLRIGRKITIPAPPQPLEPRTATETDPGLEPATP